MALVTNKRIYVGRFNERKIFVTDTSRISDENFLFIVETGFYEQIKEFMNIPLKTTRHILVPAMGVLIEF